MTQYIEKKPHTTDGLKKLTYAEVKAIKASIVASQEKILAEKKEFQNLGPGIADSTSYNQVDADAVIENVQASKGEEYKEWNSSVIYKNSKIMNDSAKLIQQYQPIITQYNKDWKLRSEIESQLREAEQTLPSGWLRIDHPEIDALQKQMNAIEQKYTPVAIKKRLGYGHGPGEFRAGGAQSINDLIQHTKSLKEKYNSSWTKIQQVKRKNG